MFWCNIFVVSTAFAYVLSVPTVYRMKDNNILEADLVPVSSTVIPLQVYKLGTGVNVTNPYEKRKIVANSSINKPLNGQIYKKFYYGNQKKGEETQLNKEDQ